MQDPKKQKYQDSGQNQVKKNVLFLPDDLFFNLLKSLKPILRTRTLDPNLG